MSFIYETKGRAREFHSLACNLYTGCGHGCVYCYGADVIRQDKARFVTEPKSRVTPGQFQREVAKLAAAGEKRPVMFCFVTDCYQPLDVDTRLTRSCIEILHAYGLGVIILTKGGDRSLRDFDILIPGLDQFAVTLTCLDDDESRKWEPHAGLPEERIDTLRQASLRGIETWVSLEPVISPQTVLDIIDRTDHIAGHYKVGTMNYHPHGKTIDWRMFGNRVIAELDHRRLRYYVKQDLAKYLGKSEGYWNETALENIRHRYPHLPVGE